MTFEIRSITEDEYSAWQATFSLVFGFDPNPADREIFMAVHEFDRSMAVFDGDEMVGTGGAFTFEMTVPGGTAVGAGGLTAIAVKPTHRRQGVLTMMMRDHLADVAARGEPTSILYASESLIYGRYGYGAAMRAGDFTIDGSRTALRSDLPDPQGRTRVTMDVEDVRADIEAVYRQATAGAGIPGSLNRNKAFWDAYFHDPDHWRDGASANRYAVYERDGKACAYARFRQKEEWTDQHPNNTVVVRDLQAVDGEAYSAIWRVVLGMDLVGKIKVVDRRLNDPLSELIADPRRMRYSVYEGVWVRIVDVPDALEARRYARAGTLVMEVVDDFGPWAGGRFLLEAGPDGAACTPTDAVPDLRLSVADLGSAYLGDSKLSTLGWLGRVEGDVEAIAIADDMFGWHLEPWSTVHF